MLELWTAAWDRERCDVHECNAEWTKQTLNGGIQLHGFQSVGLVLVSPVNSGCPPVRQWQPKWDRGRGYTVLTVDSYKYTSDNNRLGRSEDQTLFLWYMFTVHTFSSDVVPMKMCTVLDVPRSHPLHRQEASCHSYHWMRSFCPLHTEETIPWESTLWVTNFHW